MSQDAAEILPSLRALLKAQRIATLAAVDHLGEPVTALVAVAVTPDFRHLLLHLSSLSAHKRLLLANPHCSLLLHEQDDGRSQPLMLKRASIAGSAQVIARGTEDHATAAECYLSHLPASRMLFSLGDFDLIRVEIREVRFVAGFGQAFTFAAGELLATSEGS